MPIPIYSSPMKYKDLNGQYQPIIGVGGKGISSITLNNDYTLTIFYTDSTSTTVGPIKGEDGVGIVSITKTGTSGITDTYTITYTNNTTSTFTVTNGMTPSFSIGTVVEGQTASATITGTDANPVLNLVFPAAKGIEVVRLI